MSTAPARLLGPRWEKHPVVRSRRMRELALIAASAIVPLVAALAITVAMPRPSFALLIGVVAGVAAVGGLIVSTRYEITVTVVVLYLGLLDGPLVLGVAGGHQTVSAARDVLIFAICLGALLRLLVKRERIVLPPLSMWVLLFVAATLLEAFNPSTRSIIKSLAGFRQLLEWVPFFFFGYVLMRSKQRMRRVFIVLGVIAVANAGVATYQSRLSPTALAGWGPGYAELVNGGNGLTGRSFKSEGVERVRPMALGSDSGFGGGVGVIALTGTLALLASGSLRRRWPALILCIGSVLAITTAQGRLQAVGAVIALLLYAAIVLGVRGPGVQRRSVRPLATLIGVVLLMIPVGALTVSALGAGTFGRYASFVTSEHKDSKIPGLEAIPRQLARLPFGIGLGTTAAAGGIGGTSKSASAEETDGVAVPQEGSGVAVSSQYNIIADEIGLLGLLAWVGYIIAVCVLSLGSLRRVLDFELRSDLAALFASFVAIAIMGISGTPNTGAAIGPFFWFYGGVAAYWFLGPGRRTSTSTPSAPPPGSPQPTVQSALAGAWGGAGASP